MNKTSLILFVLVVGVLVFSACDEDKNPSESRQNPSTFLKTYDYGQDNEGMDILEMDNGDFLLAANHISEPDHFSSVDIVRIDSNGNRVWSKNFTKEVSYKVDEIIATDDGFVFGGTMAGPPFIHLTKIDSSGNELWNNTYSDQDILLHKISIIVTSDGNFVLAGGFYSYSEHSPGIILLKVDSNGSLVNESILWSQALSLGICEAHDGGLVLTHQYASELGYSLTVFKINDQDQVLWQYYYNVEGYDCGGIDLAPTSDGGYVVLGDAKRWGSNPRYVSLLKIDGDGQQLWYIIYDYQGDGTIVKITPDNGFIVTGSTSFFRDDDYLTALFLFKADSEGELLWHYSYNQTVNNRGNNVILTKEDGLAVVGTLYNPEPQNADVMLIKTDANGIVYD